MHLPSTKTFLLLVLFSFALLISISIAGQIFEPLVTDPVLHGRIGLLVMGTAFILFLVLGFSMAPVMIRWVIEGFLRIQMRIGNQDHRLVRWLTENKARLETGLIYGYWGIYALGMMIAAPEVVRMIREIK